jgi:hypothetical protein
MSIGLALYIDDVHNPRKRCSPITSSDAPKIFTPT